MLSFYSMNDEIIQNHIRVLCYIFDSFIYFVFVKNHFFNLKHQYVEFLITNLKILHLRLIPRSRLISHLLPKNPL